VTGTVFDVNWDPTSQQLTVAVDRGSVSVRDGSTGLEQVVRASEALRASAYEHRLLVSPSSEAAAEPTSSERAAPADTPDSQPAEPAAVEARDPITAPTAKNSDALPGKGAGAGDEWRAFAKRGALREAFAAAETAGFTQTCAAASPSELLLLGDGARLSGNSARAEEALLTLRRRYPSDARRAAAAFALGKVAFDQRGAYEQAAAWFSTCLREQPGGPLARETAGRLIEALRRADDSAGARRAARDYLEKYPEGPHADLARSVLR
jgi:TolA-binding protein